MDEMSRHEELVESIVQALEAYPTEAQAQECFALADAALRTAAEEATKRERERCAQWCVDNLSEGLGQECAEAIRAGEGEG